MPSGEVNENGALKICLYTSTALPKRGGQETVVDELTRALGALGHETIVLAPKPRRPLKADDRSLPYPVFRHPRFYSTRKLVGWYRGFLSRLYRRQRFDLLHCHGLYPPGYIAALCKARVPVPVVVTNHEGGLGANNVRAAKPLLRRRYIEALERADAWIAVSESSAAEYLSLGAASRPIVRIANGVDGRDWSAAAPRPAELEPAIRPQKYLLFLGRLRRRKGVDCLLDAFAEAFSGAGPELVIAGAGDELRALRARAHSLGLSRKCHFIGWVEGALKAYLLQNALFTVIPPRQEEAFGLVALESYAAGRPVLATSVDGLRELITPGETGMLCPPDSPPALARALREMLADTGRLERMASAASRRAGEYQWSSIARRHVALYASLLAGQNGEARGAVRAGQAGAG